MRAAASVALRSVPRLALSVPPAWRRRLLAAFAVLVVLLAGYWFWFRDSSFVRVEQVSVTGASGPQARAIRAALEEAGLDQTSLHVRVDALKAAVADYPVVRSISAQGVFPHKLRIDVSLNLPIGVLQTPAGRVAVAADGLLLRDVPITSNLPVLATKALPPAERATSGPAFELVHVVSAAPELLRARIKSATLKPGLGLVVEMTRGPELRFGDDTRIAAKWTAATRVLASPAARGATYIDLRLPERPAAGGLATTSVIPLAPAGDTPVTPATPTATTTGPTTTAPTTATTTASTTPTTATTVQQNPQPQVETTTQPSTTP